MPSITSSLISGEALAHGHLLRTPGFTYIIYSAGKNPEQLFDIRADPGQTRNLVKNSDYQTVLKEHRQLLRDWVKQTKSPVPLERIP